jgi:hypothetical protein
VADAKAFYTLLTTTAGFKKDNVLLLTDRSERTPTLRNIKWALQTFLGRLAQPDDMVIIYLAGQGAGEVDPSGRERDGLAIVAASRPGELSLEGPDLGHGIFTYDLSAQELYEYVEQQVSRKSRAIGGNQHPTMKGELGGAALPLVRLPRP